MAASLWFLLLLSPLCANAYRPSYIYLDERCGPATSTIMLSLDADLEYSNYRSTAPTKYRCQVMFQNRDRSKQVQAHFRYLNIRKSTNCSLVGLVLSDGGKNLTPRNGVCGNSRPTDLYRTKGNAMTVLLDNRGSSSYVDFELLLTSVYNAYNNDSCRDNDYKCNNGLCISSQLMCNGFNDCGDNTDEVDGCALAAGVIIGIVFGVVVFLVICSVLGVLLRRRRRMYVRVPEDFDDDDPLRVLTTQYEILNIELERLKETVEALQRRTEWQEDHIRRKNLIFFGIPRTITETPEQCEAKVRKVIGIDMGVSKELTLERVQRLKGGAVAVTFLTVEDKLHVLSRGRKLRGRQVRVSEDFSRRVREIRRGLVELKNTYRGEGRRAELRFDKLYTDFDVFTYDLKTQTVRKMGPKSLFSDHFQCGLALSLQRLQMFQSTSGDGYESSTD